MDDKLVTLAGVLSRRKEAKSDAESLLKTANAVVQEAEAALYEAMVEAEIPKFSAIGQTFTIDPKTYYNVLADDAEAFYLRMSAIGLGDIFKRTVHYQTLNATLRELASKDDDDKLPEDIAELVKTFDKGKISMRKVKG